MTIVVPSKSEIEVMKTFERVSKSFLVKSLPVSSSSGPGSEANDVLDSSISVSSTPGPENDVLDSSVSRTVFNSSISVSSTPGPERVIHSTTLPTSSSPGDGAVVECRDSPAEAICPHPPGGEEVAINNPDKRPPQKKINFQKFSKLNFDPVQPLLKFAPTFSTFPCSRPKNQTSSNVPVNDYNQKGPFSKKEIAENVQLSSQKEVIESSSNPNKVEDKEVIASNPEADDNATAIGGVCSLDSKTTGTRAEPELDKSARHLAASLNNKPASHVIKFSQD